MGMPPNDHEPSSPDDSSAPPQAKRQRINKACDVCRRRKVKCDGQQPQCGGCLAMGQTCTYSFVPKKRGPPKGYIDIIESRLRRIEQLLEKMLPKDRTVAKSFLAELRADFLTFSKSSSRHKSMQGLASRVENAARKLSDTIEAHHADGKVPLATLLSQSLGYQNSETPESSAVQRASGPLGLATKSIPDNQNPESGRGPSLLDWALQRTLSAKDRLVIEAARHSQHVDDLPDLLATDGSHPGNKERTTQPVAPSSSTKPWLFNCRPAYDEAAIQHPSLFAPNLHPPYLGSSSGITYIQSGFRNKGAFFEFTERQRELTDSLLQADRGPDQLISPLIKSRCLKAYFKYIHPYIPLLHKQVFLDDIRNNNRHPPALLMNAIYAVSSSYVSFAPQGAGKLTQPLMGSSEINEMLNLIRPGDVFFDRARRLLNQEYVRGSVTTIQSLLLMALYQQQQGSITSWMYAGMAIRLAIDLGLHRYVENPVPISPLWNRPDISDQTLDKPTAENPEITPTMTDCLLELEIRRRTWWMCYTADRLLSAGLGRPTMIHDADFDTQFPYLWPGQAKPLSNKPLSKSSVPSTRSNNPRTTTLANQAPTPSIAPSLRGPRGHLPQQYLAIEADEFQCHLPELALFSEPILYPFLRLMKIQGRIIKAMYAFNVKGVAGYQVRLSGSVFTYPAASRTSTDDRAVGPFHASSRASSHFSSPPLMAPTEPGRMKSAASSPGLPQSSPIGSPGLGARPVSGSQGESGHYDTVDPAASFAFYDDNKKQSFLAMKHALNYWFDQLPSEFQYRTPGEYLKRPPQSGFINYMLLAFYTLRILLYRPLLIADNQTHGARYAVRRRGPSKTHQMSTPSTPTATTEPPLATKRGSSRRAMETDRSPPLSTNSLTKDEWLRVKEACINAANMVITIVFYWTPYMFPGHPNSETSKSAINSGETEPRSGGVSSESESSSPSHLENTSPLFASSPKHFARFGEGASSMSMIFNILSATTIHLHTAAYMARAPVLSKRSHVFIKSSLNSLALMKEKWSSAHKCYRLIESILMLQNIPMQDVPNLLDIGLQRSKQLETPRREPPTQSQPATTPAGPSRPFSGPGTPQGPSTDHQPPALKPNQSYLDYLGEHHRVARTAVVDALSAWVDDETIAYATASLPSRDSKEALRPSTFSNTSATGAAPMHPQPSHVSAPMPESAPNPFFTINVESPVNTPNSTIASTPLSACSAQLARDAFAADALNDLWRSARHRVPSRLSNPALGAGTGTTVDGGLPSNMPSSMAAPLGTPTGNVPMDTATHPLLATTAPPAMLPNVNDQSLQEFLTQFPVSTNFDDDWIQALLQMAPRPSPLVTSLAQPLSSSMPSAVQASSAQPSPFAQSSIPLQAPTLPVSAAGSGYGISDPAQLGLIGNFGMASWGDPSMTDIDQNQPFGNFTDFNFYNM
ncbi:hypothetical protein H4R34_001370 [Dimargaris verticillata]|uniref:Zn(2)-C6 fungal-type domain-containing protein n=1 Tax=Dimargaris verticillata TaxID=2761393 RepID=A0A9W8EEJ4_9FUNG|nr:hypothetical protein H4R34_001370 [Dimargaris verticillata]